MGEPRLPVEFAGLRREPDWRRADAMVERARSAFPDLRATEWTRWMGFRPSMPNSLPVIGASPLVSHAYVACGHGHLGMTLGAVTGALIADAILGRDPMLDQSPFAPRKLRSFNPRIMMRAPIDPHALQQETNHAILAIQDLDFRRRRDGDRFREGRSRLRPPAGRPRGRDPHRRGHLRVVQARTRRVPRSLQGDIGVARELGYSVCWIERRKGLKGFGGTPVPAKLTKPDFHFASLKELADAVDAPQAA
jgi:hypothetical protein